jgi:DNA-binding CsgD family transcriptional regulator
MKSRKISPREDEVLYWVAHGLTDTQVAEKMSITPNTVNVHIRNIRKKVRPGLSRVGLAMVWLHRRKKKRLPPLREIC